MCVGIHTVMCVGSCVWVLNISLVCRVVLLMPFPRIYFGERAMKCIRMYWNSIDIDIDMSVVNISYFGFFCIQSFMFFVICTSNTRIGLQL